MNIMFAKYKKVILGTTTIIVVVIAYFSLKSQPEASFEYVSAKRLDIVKEVSVTGRVKPVSSVDLALEKAGRVVRVHVDVGDRVSQGAVLIEQASDDLRADLLKAEADIKGEEAKLLELQKGTRPEEIVVAEVKVINAKQSLADARQNLIDTIRKSHTTSDDVISNNIDQFISNPTTANPTLDIKTNQGLKSDIEFQRVIVGRTLTNWSDSLNAISGSSDIVAYTNDSKANLSKIKSFLSSVATAVNNLTGISQATIDGYKTDVSSARTKIDSSISDLNVADEKYQTEISDLALAEEELNLKLAGSTPEGILAGEAKVESAKANAQSIRAQLVKTVLRSPIEGIVTKQETKVGEIAQANEIVVSIISVGKYEIEANIPESDIAGVKVGDNANVTLDAYSSEDLFVASVARIDPAETIIDGVSTYEVALIFVRPDERIRSGMTANVDILTDSRSAVIAIPVRAVVSREGKKFVNVVDGNAYREVEVRVGLRGSDGTMEIISGIKEGDNVITFFRE
jgi:multidrug efflux pump subunit AcrA (membrane-fusion protein)